MIHEKLEGIKRSGLPESLFATDSEWDSMIRRWLSTTFMNGPGRNLTFMTEDIPEDTRRRLEVHAAKFGYELRFISFREEMDLYSMVRKSWDVSGRTSLLNFFSPKDFEYAFGWPKWKKAIDKDKVKQKRNITGRVGGTNLKDLSGWAGYNGLEETAKGLGVEVMNKGDMDSYKTNMGLGLLEQPEKFLDYAVNDVRITYQSFESFLNMFIRIQRECLDMPDEDLWDWKTIPMTTGALVAKTLEKWLYHQAGEHKNAMMFCARKLGLLDQDAKHPKYETSKRAYWRAYGKYHTIAGIDSGVKDDEMKRYFKAKFDFTALNSCGVKWWVKQTNTTAAYLALFQGGRCLNENPFEFFVDHCLDIDISGCYGETLRHVLYPVGMPRVWGFTPNEVRPTLGAWLDSNQKNLIDELWVAVVRGDLPFDQDLIFSKLVKIKEIQRVANKMGEDEDGNINSDFVMMRRQISNGIITSHVLEVLRSVCSVSEWSAFRNSELVTAGAYLSSDRCSGVEEWCEKVLADDGQVVSLPDGGVDDQRSRSWYGIPLEGFIGKLYDTRMGYKKRSQDKSLSDDEQRAAKAMDASLKLIINTTYGDIASRFFAVGNTIVGNNITAKARVAVWMVAKALGTRQSITDGGIYSPVAVPCLSGKKPGMHVLANMWGSGWKYKHGKDAARGWTPMGGVELDWQKDWDALATSHAENDALAMDHILNFWKPYGIVFPFEVAHKKEHTALRAAYWSKADYAVYSMEKNELLTKIRGKAKKSRTGERQHPTKTLLSGIVQGDYSFPEDMEHTRRGGLLKIGKYRLAQSSHGFAELKDLRPGDQCPDHTAVAQFNNTHCHITDEADYRRRRDRRPTVRGNKVLWFERYGPEGTAEVVQKMNDNKLGKVDGRDTCFSGFTIGELDQL